ncbi:hypothetical protein JL720_5911 [Aureococcus anophagefferens]|nr:hypothetical protein JL720_5911 [Aureococcus anophagefferens]
MADFEEATNDGEQEEEEEEEEEQASPEEKLQIVQHLLLSSPPGEFDDVLSDAMALVPGDLVSRPMLAGIARAYNNANLRCARAADGTLVLLSERGELEPTPTRVDHVALTAEAEAGGGPAAPGAFAAERDAAAAAGPTPRYGAECKCGAVYESDDASELAVVISGESVNLRNFWSGNWRSEWTVVLGDGRRVSGAVKGQLEVDAAEAPAGRVEDELELEERPPDGAGAGLGRCRRDAELPLEVDEPPSASTSGGARVAADAGPAGGRRRLPEPPEGLCARAVETQRAEASRTSRPELPRRRKLEHRLRAPPQQRRGGWTRGGRATRPRAPA